MREASGALYKLLNDFKTEISSVSFRGGYFLTSVSFICCIVAESGGFGRLFYSVAVCTLLGSFHLLHLPSREVLEDCFICCFTFLGFRGWFRDGEEILENEIGC